MLANVTLINFYFLIRYGVKDIILKGDKIFILLSYSPKNTTLKRKFGNLPIKYVRTKLATDEEIEMLGEVTSRYTFNIDDEEDNENLATQLGPKPGPSKKPRLGPTGFETLYFDADNDDVLLV